MPGLDNLQGRLRAWQEQLAGAWPQLQSLLDTPGTLAACYQCARFMLPMCHPSRRPSPSIVSCPTLVRVDILTVQTAVMLHAHGMSGRLYSRRTSGI